MLLGAVGLAPAGGAAVLGLGGIVTLLLWGVALALLYLWRSTIGKLLLLLADKLYNVSIPVPGKNPRPLKGVANSLRSWSVGVERTLGGWAERCESAASYLFAQTAHLLEWSAREIADLAEATASAVTGVAVAIPNAVGRAAYAQTLALIDKLRRTALRALTVAVAQVQHGLTGLERFADQQARILARGIDRLERIVTGTLPRSIAQAKAATARLGKRVAAQGKRIGKVEALLGVGAFAALMVRAMGRLGLGWLRCSNVKRTGASVCRADPSLLTDLLGALAILAITVDIEEFARDLQSVTDEVAGLIDRGIN